METVAYDWMDREWTWCEQCWGNEELLETFDTREQLDRTYGPLSEQQGEHSAPVRG